MADVEAAEQVAQVHGDEAEPNTSSPHRKSIFEMFREMAVQLDERHDKYERIVKLSRDITIDSKKIIFLLHRHTTEPDVVERAEGRFRYLRDRLFKELAAELENEDPFQYISAFTHGVQEYIEALSLHHFLKTGTLISHEEVQRGLFFEVLVDDPDRNSSYRGHGHGYGGRGSYNQRRGGGGNYYRNNYSSQNMRQDANTPPTPEPVAVAAEEGQGQVEEEKPKPPTPPPPAKKTIHIFLPQTDFVLGLCDLTGELMRGCVSAVGSGNTEYAFKTCTLVQQFYKGMIGLHPLYRSVYGKIDTLRQSVMKMERSCCQLKIRETQGGNELSRPFRAMEDDKDDLSDSGLD